MLGVPRDASPELIKKIYTALVKAYHPDTFPGDKKHAKEKLQEINAAYEVLSSSSKRKKLDPAFPRHFFLSLSPSPLRTD